MVAIVHHHVPIARARDLIYDPCSWQMNCGRSREMGGGERDRTDDILLAKQKLYQLSYAPSFSIYHSLQE